MVESVDKSSFQVENLENRPERAILVVAVGAVYELSTMLDWRNMPVRIYGALCEIEAVYVFPLAKQTHVMAEVAFQVSRAALTWYMTLVSSILVDASWIRAVSAYQLIARMPILSSAACARCLWST